MSVITFEQIHADVARFHADHNAPATVACRAIETLRDALADCTASERRDILALLAEETAELAPIVA